MDGCEAGEHWRNRVVWRSCWALCGRDRMTNGSEQWRGEGTKRRLMHGRGDADAHAYLIVPAVLTATAQEMVAAGLQVPASPDVLVAACGSGRVEAVRWLLEHMQKRPGVGGVTLRRRRLIAGETIACVEPVEALSRTRALAGPCHVSSRAVHLCTCTASRSPTRGVLAHGKTFSFLGA